MIKRMNNRQLYFLFTAILGIGLPFALPFMPVFVGSYGYTTAEGLFSSYETNGDVLLILFYVFIGLASLAALVRILLVLFGGKEKPWTAVLVSNLVHMVAGLAASILVLSQGQNVPFLVVFPFTVVIGLVDFYFDQKMAQKEVS